MIPFHKIVVSLSLLLVVSACTQDRQQPTFKFTITNPAEMGTQYPHLHTDNKGVITMSWFQNIEEELNSIQYSTYQQAGWTEPRTVNISSDYFVNWADFPSVVSLDGKTVAAHWLRKIEGGPYAYNVNIVFPDEQARRWTDPITPHSDNTPTEHGFVSMEPLSENTVLAIWLDGRHTADREHDEYGDPGKAMTLRSAEISRDGSVRNAGEIDSMVCDCCTTDLTITDDGAVAVYRNRTDNEIRDISFVVYSREMGAWSDPRPVHEDGWAINGCPVNGPAIDYNENTGQTAVAWYTEAEGVPRVKLAVADNNELEFGDPIIISEGSTAGRTDVVIRDNGKIYTSWLETSEGNGYIMMRSLSDGVEPGVPIQVGITSSSRRSGFPQMALAADGLFFAWTQTDPYIRVRNAKVRFEQLEEAESIQQNP